MRGIRTRNGYIADTFEKRLAGRGVRNSFRLHRVLQKRRRHQVRAGFHGGPDFQTLVTDVVATHSE